jgi:hypothetical protein
VNVKRQEQDGILVDGEDHPNNMYLNRMFHRLSEAFEEAITGKERQKNKQGGQTLSGFARFSKEGWEDMAPNQFGFPNAPLDPKTEIGSHVGKNLGGVDAVKWKYDSTIRKAKDDTQLNQDRSKEINEMYGIYVPQPSSTKITGPTQVYAVGPDYRYTRAEAAGICAKYGGQVATSNQLEAAQKAGADWCFSGWVSEGVGKWPITTNPVPGCGWRGVMNWTPDWSNPPRAGVTCYGPKPRMEDVKKGEILSFNGTLWDQPTERTYITVDSGYLETSGSQTACFDGLSPDQAKKNCDRLGSQCMGFSYSKDGTGSGCYKGNLDAGLNQNGAYMGYVKVPVDQDKPVDGRYIRLDYNHVNCLNLAQILVYSSEGGPNLITAQTPVTRSSVGYWGNIYPSANFVNQKGNQWGNFVHTSCGDVPWIEVDLGSVVRIHKVVVWNRQDCCQSRVVGTVLSILDGDREKVYISNPIRTTNQTYTWFPPNGNVFTDRDPIRRQTVFKPSEWKCLGGMPTPIRRNQDGEIECMSYNARDCLWGNDGTCRNLLTNANWGAVRPLVCGADHARKWGGPGYDNSGHWCARADQQL